VFAVCTLVVLVCVCVCVVAHRRSDPAYRRRTDDGCIMHMAWLGTTRSIPRKNRISCAAACMHALSPWPAATAPPHDVSQLQASETTDGSSTCTFTFTSIPFSHVLGLLLLASCMHVFTVTNSYLGKSTQRIASPNQQLLRHALHGPDQRLAC